MGASNDSFSYVSEPTSPSRWEKEIIFFYSVPPSPGIFHSPSQPATPWAYEDANSSFDDFEFETSRRLNLNDLDIDIENDFNFDERIEMERQQEKQDRQLATPLPEMAFADDLFFNGKVLPLLPKLKLPPRLQHENSDNGGKKRTTASSPRSPISVLKSKFSGNNLSDSSLDPFMVALENVREDDGGKRKHTGAQTRAKSHVGLKVHSPLREPEPIGPRPDTLSGSVWTHPKGLAIARKLRLVKMGFESNFGPTEEKKNENTKKMEGKKGRSFSLLRSLSMRKPTFFRRLKLKSVGSTRISKDEKVTTRTTLVKYRPRFSLCLGFRPKFNN